MDPHEYPQRVHSCDGRCRSAVWHSRGRRVSRTGGSRSHFFNAAAIQELPDSVAVDAVIVTEQESGLTTEGRGFSKLLNDPFHGGMVRRCEMNHPPSTMFKDDKNVEK